MKNLTSSCFLFMITNCQTVHSRLLTHCINHTFVSVCIWKLANEQARISPVIVQTYIVMKTEKKHNFSQNPTTQTARSPSDNYNFTVIYRYYVKPLAALFALECFTKGWFSLAQKHKHKHKHNISTSK